MDITARKLRLRACARFLPYRGVWWSGSILKFASLYVIARTPRYDKLSNFENEMVPPKLLLLLRSLRLCKESRYQSY